MTQSAEKKTVASRPEDLVDEVRESAKAGQHAAARLYASFVRQSMRRFLSPSNRYARRSSTPPSNWLTSSSPRSTSSTAALCAVRTGH